MVINSEFRLPVFSTFIDKTINNAFLKTSWFTQFIDLGTAWNGTYKGISRPSQTFTNTQGTVTVRKKAGGIGPFAGGYGFGARYVAGLFRQIRCGLAHERILQKESR